jgi:hypothetical protein
LDQTDREFLDRVEAVIASQALLGRVRLFFECLGFIKQQADLGRLSQLLAGTSVWTVLDDALQVVLKQAESEQTTLGLLIADGFSNPRAAEFQRVFERRRAR